MGRRISHRGIIRRAVYAYKKARKLGAYDTVKVSSITKEPYQMSLQEFNAHFLDSALQHTNYGAISKPEAYLYRAWRDTVIAAIEQLKEGIDIEVLTYIRNRYRKDWIVINYCRHFSLKVGHYQY